MDVSRKTKRDRSTRGKNKNNNENNGADIAYNGAYRTNSSLPPADGGVEIELQQQRSGNSTKQHSRENSLGQQRQQSQDQTIDNELSSTPTNNYDRRVDVGLGGTTTETFPQEFDAGTTKKSNRLSSKKTSRRKLKGENSSTIEDGNDIDDDEDDDDDFYDSTGMVPMPTFRLYEREKDLLGLSEELQQKKRKHWQTVPMEEVLEDFFIQSHPKTRVLPADTYSILVFADWSSYSGLMCLLTCTVQVALFALILWDNLTEDREGGSFFQIPPGIISVQQRICQLLVIMAAVCYQDDVITSIQSWTDGFHLHYEEMTEGLNKPEFGKRQESVDVDADNDSDEDARLTRFKTWTMPKAFYVALYQERHDDHDTLRKLKTVASPNADLSGSNQKQKRMRRRRHFTNRLPLEMVANSVEEVGLFERGPGRAKWSAANGLRFFEGILGLGMTGLVIFLQTTVLDILLSFTALEAVTAIDDVIFGLMKREFLGQQAFRDAEMVESTIFHFPSQADRQQTKNKEEQHQKRGKRWWQNGPNFFGWLLILVASAWVAIFKRSINLPEVKEAGCEICDNTADRAAQKELYLTMHDDMRCVEFKRLAANEPNGFGLYETRCNAFEAMGYYCCPNQVEKSHWCRICGRPMSTEKVNRGYAQIPALNNQSVKCFQAEFMANDPFSSVTCEDVQTNEDLIEICC